MAEKLESDYIKLLESIAVEPKYLEMGRVIVKRIWDQKVKDTSTNQEIKKSEKKELEKMIDEYVDLIPKTKSDAIRARYEEKIDALDKRIKELEIEPEIKKAPDIDEALDLTLKLLGTPAETWKNSDRQTKTLLHKMIFTENPTYSIKTGFGTPKLSLPFHIKQYICNFNSGVVDRT